MIEGNGHGIEEVCTLMISLFSHGCPVRVSLSLSIWYIRGVTLVDSDSEIRVVGAFIEMFFIVVRLARVLMTMWSTRQILLLVSVDCSRVS